MSTTATNGAATEAAIRAVTKATNAAGKVVVDTAAAIGPSMESAGGKAKEAGQTWLEASKTIAGLSLDAYEASIKAYLEYTRSVVAAGKAGWATELADNNARILGDLAATYSTAARDLLGA